MDITTNDFVGESHQIWTQAVKVQDKNGICRNFLQEKGLIRASDNLVVMSSINRHP